MSPWGGKRDRAGRKPPEGERRKPMQVMLTDEERALLDEAAADESLGTSTWLRALGVKTAKAKKRAR